MANFPIANEVARRIQREIQELMQTYRVEPGEDLSTYYVLLRGPSDSLYRGGYFRVELYFGEEYPTVSPRITFENPILHPNISVNGNVCISLLRGLWDTEFTLNHIFGIFIPTILREPTYSDPLNEEAAEMHKQNVSLYEEKVIRMVQEAATDEVAEFFVVPDEDEVDEEPDEDKDEVDEEPDEDEDEVEEEPDEDKRKRADEVEEEVDRKRRRQQNGLEDSTVNEGGTTRPGNDGGTTRPGRSCMIM